MAQVTANIIVTCKGRLKFLKQSIPLMMIQEYTGRWWVTVVDYDDPDGSTSWCMTQQHAKLNAIKVLDTDGNFRLGHARNIGAVRSFADVLCFVDADCLLSPKWLQSVVDSIQDGCRIVLPSELDADLSGTCAFLSQFFHDCRGYDESFLGWGWDDTDMYQRATTHGGYLGRFDRSLVQMMHHDNELRAQYYSQKDLWQSHLHNVGRANDPNHGMTNPRGYGIARCVSWWPQDTCVTATVSS